MRNGIILTLALIVAGFAAASPIEASAAQTTNTTYYYVPSVGGNYQYKAPVTLPSYNYYGSSWSGSQMSESQLIAFLQQLIVQLQAQLQAKGSYYGSSNYYGSGYGYVIGGVRPGSSSSYGDDEPEVITDSATSINRTDAKLRGSVDMNDFEDGEVFFVYGTDESDIEDVEDDFDSYSDVDTNGQRLQKVRVDSSLDGDDEYEHRVSGLSRDTDYYFQICVGFEDEDDDDVIICGGVEEFTTDN